MKRPPPGPRTVAAIALVLGVGAIGLAGEIRYPSDVLPQHHDELSALRRKTDLAALAATLQRKAQAPAKAPHAAARLLVAQIILRAQAAEAAPSGPARDELVDQLLELATVYHTFAPVVLGEAAWIHPFFSDTELRAVAPRPPHSSFAANLADAGDQPLGMEALAAREGRDLLDPRSSAFWNRVPLEGYETYDYARSGLRDALCRPDALYEFESEKDPPEKGGGRNPGYKLTVALPGAAGRTKVSAKLAMRTLPGLPLFAKQEAYVEPAANALYRALGFNVDDSFFCPSIRIKFHPSLLAVPPSPLIDKAKWNFALYYDQAIARNGTSRPFAEAVRAGDSSGIAALTTHGVLLEVHPADTQRLVAWWLTGLSHEDRRELRALPLFDTWLANLDDFGFNLKLALARPHAPTELADMKFLLADTGMSFSPQYTILPDKTLFFEPKELQAATARGQRDAALARYRGMSDLELSVNGFSWSVFQNGQPERPSPAALGEAERMARVGQDLYFFESPHVQQLLPYMTWEDLRWATRKIAALSEDQILHAACLSGLGYPGARLLTEKLLSRRDQLVEYFGLQSEWPRRRPGGPDTGLTVSGDGAIQVRTSGGQVQTVKVPSYGYRVEKGVFHTS